MNTRLVINMKKLHKISGLDSAYGGSMFNERSDTVQFMHVLDARDDSYTDTYLDLAVHNVEIYGSAIITLRREAV
jgi:hypothetical protein